MKKLTKEQYETIMTQAKDTANLITEDKTVREILSQLYVDNLDEKTKRQGDVMADAILDSVRQFDSDYADAKNDLDKYIARVQREIDKDKSSAERCTYWLKFTTILALSATGQEITEEELERLEVSETDATDQYEEELRQKAKEAIKNNNIMFMALMQQKQELEEWGEAEDTVRMLVEFENKEIEFRAIAAMLTYIKIKTGEFDNIPVDMTLDQVTTIVCAEIEQMQIAEAVGNNTLPEKIAVFMLTVLGGVVLSRFALSAVISGLGIATGLFTAIPLCMAITGIGLCAWACVLGIVAGTSICLHETLSEVVPAAMSGIDRILDFVKENILPVVANMFDNLLKWVKGQITKGSETAEQSEESLEAETQEEAEAETVPVM